MQPAVKRIAVVTQRWTGYLHGVQLGIAEYFLQRPNWIWNHIQPEPRTWNDLQHMPVDGIIVFVDSQYVDRLLAQKAPVVDVANWSEEAYFPRVHPDDAAIGEMAAKYLMDQGLRNFASIGYPSASFYRERLRGFVGALKEAGFRSAVWSPEVDAARRYDAPLGIDGAVLHWLSQLPKPVGLMCGNDYIAADVLAVCRYGGLKVPEDICVLGVDNDELIQKVSRPPLSSIAVHTEKVGFEAARLLDQLMSGVEPPKAPVLLPPKGVMARQSTNLLAIADQDVLEAVRYIRLHLHQHITVRDLLRVVPVNRRFLERKFREHLGRTPLQEIRRARIETAKQLLADTDMSMPAVAKRSGFPNPERLANVFHAMVGVTPTNYRRKFRLHDH